MKTKAQKFGLKLLWEAFPDREYYQGKLLDRTEKRAVLQDTKQIIARALQLKKKQTILDYEKKIPSTNSLWLYWNKVSAIFQKLRLH